MESSKNSSQNSPHDPSAFSGWGIFVGAGIGLLIGLFTHHWVGWMLAAAFIGWITGALIDRSRRG